MVNSGHRPIFITQRFASPQARFRSAVTLGFLIVAVGVLLGGLGSHALFANEGLWTLSQLFAPVVHPAERNYDLVDHMPARADVRLRANILHRHVRHAWGVGQKPVAMPLARRSMCVRTCDGYAFPVGDYHGEGDRPAQQMACQAACPEAKTALYVMPVGTDRIEQAVEVATGRSYSALPDAFRFTTLLDDACTCHRPGGARTLSLLRDHTLRRGDAVMTARGFRVFHGAARFPYRRTDFLALSKTQDIRKSDRPAFSALERASLKGSVAVKQMSPERAPQASLEAAKADRPGA